MENRTRANNHYLASARTRTIYGFLFSVSDLERRQLATQRVIVAKIGGAAAHIVARQFEHWEQTKVDDEFPTAVRVAVDNFAEQLRSHSGQPPIVYFAEWIDMWSVGGLVTELDTKRNKSITGRRYEACFHRPPLIFTPTAIEDEPMQESLWLKRRLEEATNAWDVLVPDWIVVILREPLAGCILDEEIVASLKHVPNWLTSTR